MTDQRRGRRSSAQKTRSGPPKGNRNAVKHGAYLSMAKRTARELRDKYRRRGEREAKEILSAQGLGDDPMAKLVARQIGRLEAMAHRLEAWHDARGYFTASGELKSSVSKEIEVISRLLDEARKLLERSKGGGGTGFPLPAMVQRSFEIEDQLLKEIAEELPSASVEEVRRELIKRLQSRMVERLQSRPWSRDGAK